MSLLTDFRELMADLADEFGGVASLVRVEAVYADGNVTETTEQVSVTVAGPVDESRRYAATGADQQVTGTFYLSADGLTVEPRNGDRIVWNSRTFSVIETMTYSVQGGTIGWRLDVGETGNS